MVKKDLVRQEKRIENFWLFAVLICVLLVSISARDIDRPFTGLHSWGQAHEPYLSRVHLKYGLGYTKGFMTWAVGNPPIENPPRYLDHPQLPILIDAGFMAILGANDWTLRAVNIAITVVSLILLIKIVRGLLEDKTALFAGLLFALFPLNAYFGAGNWITWMYPLVFCAIWCYLVLIGGLKDGPEAGRIHRWGLAISLFFAIQMSWEGFFFAMGIGVHYVFRCIFQKKMPDKVLLTILIAAPLISLGLVFVTLAAGKGWDFARIMEVYKWRASSGELEKHDWGKWFAKLWEFCVSNFTLPVMILAIGSVTVGQVFAFVRGASKKAGEAISYRFPHFWFFVLPAIFQLVILKGCLWKHQTWLRPLMLPVAIGGAIGIVLLAELAGKIRPVLARYATVLLVAVITVACAAGLNEYYSISHFSPEKVKLFKKLNANIPEDKALLSFQDFIVNQHKAKGSFIRPEIAWYLDRQIVKATTPAEISEKAKTGRYPYYLIPLHQQLMPLINELAKSYKYEQISGDPGGPGKAPMMPYILFDLRSRVNNG